MDRPTIFRTFGRLESPVCDLALMAGVNSSIVEAAMNVPEEARIHKGHVQIATQEADELLFCAYHLEDMVRDLKAKYYELLEGQPS
jgi:hypothetical protein